MADALSDKDARELLTSVPGWDITDGKLFRELKFADFNEAFGFMARVALIAEKLDHHPDWTNSWNTVEIELVNHSAGGLTPADFEFAGRVNGLLGG